MIRLLSRIFHPNTARIARDRLHWVVSLDRGLNNDWRGLCDQAWQYGHNLRVLHGVNAIGKHPPHFPHNVRRIRPGGVP